MKKILPLLLLLTILSCQKKPKPAELTQHLKKAMAAFLYEKINNDSSRVKYEIKDVIYFEERDFYECEFQVRMQQAGIDTTGAMKARITKDFAKVTRKL